jgi:hypothetical protein
MAFQVDTLASLKMLTCLRTGVFRRDLLYVSCNFNCATFVAGVCRVVTCDFASWKMKCEVYTQLLKVSLSPLPPRDLANTLRRFSTINTGYSENFFFALMCSFCVLLYLSYYFFLVYLTTLSYLLHLYNLKLKNGS